MTAMLEKLEGQTLADLAKMLSRTENAGEKFLAKVYSFIPPSTPQFLEFIKHVKLKEKLFPNEHGAAILIGDISKIVTSQTEPVFVTKDKKLSVFFILQKIELPAADYLTIVSPIPTGGERSSYAPNESIAFLRTFLALFFGKIVQYKWVADFEFDFNGQVSLPSPVIRLPLHADFFKLVAPDLAVKIIDRLQLQLPEYRIRLQRACNLFDMALNQSDEAYRFASYWIALEVLVGSTGGAVKNKLAEAYGFGSDVSRVGKLLLFDQISNIRGDLIHKGIFTKILSFHERLLQLYFWDIVIFQIGLPNQSLAKLLVDSGIAEEELIRESQNEKLT
ncbi:MAG: hypothetical protein HY244_07680 [Rhizobiales bacterium]|nr:hypothetical protein [Hyphomicrobiales bacterium]